MGNIQSGDTLSKLPHTVPASSGRERFEAETCVYRSAAHPVALIDGLVDDELHVAYDVFRRGYQIADGGRGAMLGVRKYASGGLLGGDDGSQLLPEYGYLSYGEVDALAGRLGANLLRLRLVEPQHHPEEAYAPAQTLRVLCIASRNRAEWFITDLACQRSGITTCPLYETFGAKSIRYILEQTKSRTVAGSLTNLRGILDIIQEDRAAESSQPPLPPAPQANEENEDPQSRPRSRPAWLRFFFSFDNHVPFDLVERAADCGIQVYTWKQVMEAIDQEPEFEIAPPQPHDVCSICYTSGTTGLPKGVLITQKAFAANIAAAIRGPLMGQGLDITTEDIYMSYLPLAHVLERVLCCICMSLGAKIAIYAGDTRTLLDDIKVAEPTIFTSVPRLFMRINDRIQVGLDQQSGLVRFLYERGIATKIAKLRETGDATHVFWDQLVFRRIRALLGSRLRYMISGGAALEKEIQEKMACIFSVRFLEGYGLTETLGATFIRRGLDCIYGHIGMPLPCVEIKLRAAAEMRYYVTKADEIRGEQEQRRHPSGVAAGGSPLNRLCSELPPQRVDEEVIEYSPSGELLVRGFSVTPGYFLNAEATREAFEDDDPLHHRDGRTYRWFKTGDIAVRLADQGGRVKIIDRKKNLFKMSQGEYIAPERIENVYSQIPVISQIFVYGDSSRVYLVAIVTLDAEEYQKWLDTAAATADPLPGNAKGLSKLPPPEHELEQRFKEHLLAEMDRAALDAQLKGFEKVKNIWCTTDQFTPESGILTPTFKLKRNVARDRYWDRILALYNESF